MGNLQVRPVTRNRRRRYASLPFQSIDPGRNETLATQSKADELHMPLREDVLPPMERGLVLSPQAKGGIAKIPSPCISGSEAARLRGCEMDRSEALVHASSRGQTFFHVYVRLQRGMREQRGSNTGPVTGSLGDLDIDAASQVRLKKHP